MMYAFISKWGNYTPSNKFKNYSLWNIEGIFRHSQYNIYMQLTCNCHTFWDESTSQLRRLATICTLKIDGAPLGTRGVSAMSFLSRVQDIRNHLSHTYTA